MFKNYLEKIIIDSLSLNFSWMIRICIFVHFNKNNSLEDNVIDYLKRIKELVEENFFISKSKIDKENKIILNNIVSKI